MKKSIRLFGTTLVVTGMGIGGTFLAAGAASADTGTQAVTVQASTVQASTFDLTHKNKGDKDGDRCWWDGGKWRHDDDKRDNCKDRDGKHDDGGRHDGKHDDGGRHDGKHDDGKW
jgi:hypothetical protein